MRDGPLVSLAVPFPDSPWLPALVAASLCLVPSRAMGDAQVSSRLGLGGGARFVEGETRGLFDMALRAEVLFGAPGDEHVRVGPALDVRTATFDTLELAGGAAVLLPTWRGYPIVLTVGVGHAFRRDELNAPFLLTTFAWGYRSYNFHGPYGFGLMGYVSARTNLQDPRAWEIVFGVEIDLQFLVAMPAMGLRMLFKRGAPDEPKG
jgi:hypothetical protein